MICKLCKKRIKSSEGNSNILCPECEFYDSFKEFASCKTEIKYEKRFESLEQPQDDVRRKKIRNLSLLVISGIVLILFLTPLGQFLLLIIAFLLSGPPDW